MPGVIPVRKRLPGRADPRINCAAIRAIGKLSDSGDRGMRGCIPATLGARERVAGERVPSVRDIYACAECPFASETLGNDSMCRNAGPLGRETARRFYESDTVEVHFHCSASSCHSAFPYIRERPFANTVPEIARFPPLRQWIAITPPSRSSRGINAAVSVRRITGIICHDSDERAEPRGILHRPSKYSKPNFRAHSIALLR